MKHFFALPALLRPALLLAAASQNTFSVNDDLLAFPQYEVKFDDEYITELQALSKLESQNNNPNPDATSDALGHYQPPPPHDSPDNNDGKKEGKVVYESMRLGPHRYLCTIPQVQKPDDAFSDNDTLSRAEEERELARATDRGWELLSAMQGNCIYFISGWWSYRFCYGQGIKQFHQLPPSRGVPNYPPVEDPGVEGFYLGSYEKSGEKGAPEDDEEVVGEEQEPEVVQSEMQSALDVSEGAKKRSSRRSGNGELVQRGESRYLVQRLGGGTKCDLTGKERKIEVQFHCNPQSADRISLIKETSTCAYLMVIQTPRLCSDVAFLPPQKDQPNAISCSPILSSDEIPEYERELQALQSAEKEASEQWEAHIEAAAALGNPEFFADDGEQALQIVGDIVVGGHLLVPPGKKIEKSTIVGGGKETYVDTVASSDGRILSEEDIKRLGLGDPRAVEKLRKELEKIAQGQNWKLDVIDTPRGREYRGIIGDEDEEEEGKGMGKGKEAKKEKGEVEEEEKTEGSQEEYYKEEL